MLMINPIDAARTKSVANRTCTICRGTGTEEQFVHGVIRTKQCRCIQFKKKQQSETSRMLKGKR